VNGEEHGANGRECAGDAAAYVLGALEPSEVEAFRRHLAGCPACRDEVAAFELLTEALPAGSTIYPVPKDLRRRVMREVRATPRQPAPGRAAPSVPIGAGPVRRRLVAWGAPAVAVVAVILAFVLASGGSSATRVIQASVSGSSASAQLRIAGGRGELVVAGLPQPSAGRIYELWVQHGSARPAPTGTLFGVTAAGGAAVGVPGSLDGVSAVMVTEEPAGGTLAPTSAPVIVARLT
jgi:anti-sigma-K factor RskA